MKLTDAVRDRGGGSLMCDWLADLHDKAGIVMNEHPESHGPEAEDAWTHWTQAHDFLLDELANKPERVRALCELAQLARTKLHYDDAGLRWHRYDERCAPGFSLTCETCEAIAALASLEPARKEET